MPVAVIKVNPSTNYVFHAGPCKYLIWSTYANYADITNATKALSSIASEIVGPTVITTTAATNYIVLAYSNYRGTNTVTVDENTPIMFEQGSIATSYISYSNAVEVGSSRKNLFPMNKWMTNGVNINNGTLDSFVDGNLTMTSTNNDCYTYTYEMSTNNSVNIAMYSKYGFPVEPNTIYTLSYNKTTTKEVEPYIFYYDNDFNYLSLYNQTWCLSTFCSNTFTTPATAVYATVRFGISSSGVTETFSNIQIEKGSTATTYQPYEKHSYTITLDAPLRCVPSSSDGIVCDYIDFKNQRVVRNVGEMEFDGTEGWVTYGGYMVNPSAWQTSVFAINIPQKQIGYHTSICDHFYNSNDDAAFTNTLAKNGLYTDHPNLTTTYFDYGASGLVLNDFTSWLAAQAAAGTPVIVQYQLATPTYEYFDVENLLMPTTTSKTMNGITFTVANDGTITMNGTAIAEANFGYNLSVQPPLTMSINNSQTSDGVLFRWGGSIPYGRASVPNASLTYTSAVSVAPYLAQILVESGTTLTDFTVKPQLEVGSVAHPYVPYGSPIPPLPKVETASGSASLWATDGNLQSSNLQVHYWQE
ncbi:MAG: hypothetical protein Q4G02_03255 [bacterium]|nr:hypothetical protein [bacterium]